ncbi:MAG: hypothetical protein WCV93_05730 [Candidatus Shapirobacteria bacterium]|jgi:hypothetical protein
MNIDKRNHLEKIQKVLVMVAEKTNTLGIDWYLGSSGALMVHGIDVVPKDLDILTNWKNIEKITGEFKSFVVDNNPDGIKLEIEGIEVEVLGLSDLREPKLVLFKNRLIPVSSLDDLLLFYKSRPGKTEIVRMIEEKTRG